jgi:hypothetical protein
VKWTGLRSWDRAKVPANSKRSESTWADERKILRFMKNSSFGIGAWSLTISRTSGAELLVFDESQLTFNDFAPELKTPSCTQLSLVKQQDTEQLVAA